MFLLNKYNEVIILRLKKKSSYFSRISHGKIMLVLTHYGLPIKIKNLMSFKNLVQLIICLNRYLSIKLNFIFFLIFFENLLNLRL